MTDPSVERATTPTERAGQLTNRWAVVVCAVWAGIVAGFAAVWVASRQIGLSTWWLGAPVGGRSLPISLVPFIPGVLVIAAVILGARSVWFVGSCAALIAIGIGIGDLGRVTRLGIVEIALGTAGLLVSAASWTGTWRQHPGSATER